MATTIPPAINSSFAAMLRGAPGYAKQIVHERELPARPDRRQQPTEPLSPALQERLAAMERDSLYLHQAQALDAARQGEHVCVVTSTASGKSLCYLLPILDTVLRDPQARALLLFPTKALLHDQKRALDELLGNLPVSVGVYDGDTATSDLPAVRRSQIVLSNPDKVHVGLLPYAGGGWSGFLRNLRYVVVDEAHSYSGIFGGHVALVLRRLFRVCERAGASPQVICCSATIGNPAAHVEALTGVERVRVIDENGAPGASREILFWEVPGNSTAEQQALGLFTTLIRDGKQTLLFTSNRQSADWLVQQALETDPSLRGKIASYRAGYLAAERRRIEAEMREGALRGLISTNANELGVNIGALDAVVMCGFPGTVASFWQQAGRAGRAQQPALAVLVGGTTPLEAYYFANPAELLEAPVEPAHLPVENPNLLRDQLWCAARDAELKRTDSRWFGGEETLRATAAQLVEDGRLAREQAATPGAGGAPRYYYRLRDPEAYPPQMVSLRSIGSVSFRMEDSRGRLIEQGFTLAQVLRETYPGAIYYSQLRVYRIREVDYPNLLIVAGELDEDPGYITQAQMATAISTREPREELPQGAARAAWGNLTVTERLTGYIERPRGRGVPREVPLTMLPRTLETEGVWWEISPDVLERLADQGHDELASMRSLARLLLALLPVFSQSDARDTALDVAMQSNGYITIYDEVEGGCGLTRRGFEQAQRWLEMAEARLGECRCARGCPACIHAGPPVSRHIELDKTGARLLARLMLGLAPLAEKPKKQPTTRVAHAITPAPKISPALKPTREHAARPLPGVEPALTLAQVQDRWPQVRGELRARSESRLFELILAAEPVAIRGLLLTLDFGDDADVARLFAQGENSRIMENAFRHALGLPYRLRCIAKGYDSKKN